MIVVVEGISASGKTTWCRTHAPGCTVPETGPGGDAPDAARDPEAAARFWVEHNAGRWQAACSMERLCGVAVCDTDPVKLHYVWSLWRIGMGTEAAWQAGRVATREAIARGRIGFGDVYLVKSIEPWRARQQRDADLTRSRRNFERHVRLLGPLAEWYEALGAVLPGCVMWGLPEAGLGGLSARGDRGVESAVGIFDRLVAALPS